MNFIKRYFYLLPVTLMIASALAKLFVFAPKPPEGDMALLHEHLVWLGILEIVCALIFLYPATRKIGFLLVCSYWGGAIAIDLIYTHKSPVTAAGILAMFWVGMFLKDRNMFLGKS
jgi:hypothetical protein